MPPLPPLPKVLLCHVHSFLTHMPLFGAMVKFICISSSWNAKVRKEQLLNHCCLDCCRPVPVEVWKCCGLPRFSLVFILAILFCMRVNHKGKFPTKLKRSLVISYHLITTCHLVAACARMAQPTACQRTAWKTTTQTCVCVKIILLTIVIWCTVAAFLGLIDIFDPSNTFLACHVLSLSILTTTWKRLFLLGHKMLSISWCYDDDDEMLKSRSSRLQRTCMLYLLRQNITDSKKFPRNSFQLQKQNFVFFFRVNSKIQIQKFGLLVLVSASVILGVGFFRIKYLYLYSFEWTPRILFCICHYGAGFQNCFLYL